MSGIAAIVTFDGSAVRPSDVEGMVTATPWRGDVVTRWTGDGSALVAQRHPAPHLSTSGITADDDLVVLADARIDNRQEVRSSVRSAGWDGAAPASVHPWDDPQGDISLIAAAFRCWGPSFAERLIGDFSIVIWDRHRRRLILARDPMGMRPLYYRAEARNRLIVASEAKQILHLPTVARRVNEAAVGAYLLTDANLPGDQSYWQTVSQLQEGHLLTCDVNGQTRRRYWDIDPEHRIFHPDRRTTAEHVAQVLTDAVVARLHRSTAPAIMLSGGMDSGSVAAIAGRHQRLPASGAPVPSAYSWAFDELTECDERHISRHIVDHYGLGQIDVPADDAGPLDGYPDHDVDLDDPVVGAFQTLIDRTLLCARDDGVDLMLGGDRGDLVFGPTTFGYLSLALARQWTAVRREIAEHRRALGDPLWVIAQQDFFAPLVHRIRRRNPAGWARWAVNRVAARRQPRTSPPPWVRPTIVQHADDARQTVTAHLQPSRAQRYGFVFTPLHMRGMTWSERTYAHRGMQFADPFSDRRVVELVLALPQAHIGRPNDDSKPLLRDAMRGVMPESARIAARKILPSPLYARGLKRNRVVVEQLLTDSRAAQRGWLDNGALHVHYVRWLAGAPLDASFWYALSVERWLRVGEG